MHTNLHVVTGLFDGMNVATNKIILGFHLVSILPSSRYDVIRHEGFTTTTFYGHRVKQKISFRLNFVMPSSWYDVTSHKVLTTYTSHYLETLPMVRVPTMARDTMGNVQDRPG